MLNDVLSQISAFIIARLQALKTYVNTVKSQLESAISSEASARQAADTALGQRIDGVQSDLSAETTARQAADAQLQSNLDAVETSLTAAIESEESARIAADSALGARIDSETAARIAGDASVLAQAIAASKMNVRKAFFYDLKDGNASLSSIVGSLEDGSYQVFFAGEAQEQATISGLKDTNEASFSGVVSNGDIYYFNVVGGLVKDGILADDKNQVKFDAVDTEIDTLKGRVSATEASIAALDSTYATDSDVDSKILGAFTTLYNNLVNGGYTDPN